MGSTATSGPFARKRAEDEREAGAAIACGKQSCQIEPVGRYGIISISDPSAVTRAGGAMQGCTGPGVSA